MNEYIYRFGSDLALAQLLQLYKDLLIFYFDK